MTETAKKPQLEDSWMAVIGDEFEKPYMAALKQFLSSEYKSGASVYPPGPLMFNAMNTTPFDAVKVVILGQDPYHGPNQARNTRSEPA